MGPIVPKKQLKKSPSSSPPTVLKPFPVTNTGVPPVTLTLDVALVSEKSFVSNTNPNTPRDRGGMETV